MSTIPYTLPCTCSLLPTAHPPPTSPTTFSAHKRQLRLDKLSVARTVEKATIQARTALEISFATEDLAETGVSSKTEAEKKYKEARERCADVMVRRMESEKRLEEARALVEGLREEEEGAKRERAEAEGLKERVKRLDRCIRDAKVEAENAVRAAIRAEEEARVHRRMVLMMRGEKERREKKEGKKVKAVQWEETKEKDEEEEQAQAHSEEEEEDEEDSDEQDEDEEHEYSSPSSLTRRKRTAEQSSSTDGASESTSLPSRNMKRIRTGNTEPTERRYLKTTPTGFPKINSFPFLLP